MKSTAHYWIILRYLWEKTHRQGCWSVLPSEPSETPHTGCQGWGLPGDTGYQWRTAPPCCDRRGWSSARRRCWSCRPQQQAGTRSPVLWCLSCHARPPGWEHQSLERKEVTQSELFTFFTKFLFLLICMNVLPTMFDLFEQVSLKSFCILKHLCEVSTQQV